jgi:hypothetical protein
MRLAARCGHTWVAIDLQDTLREQLRRLDEICVAMGRDPMSLRRLALLGARERPLASIEAFRDVLGRYTERGFTDLVVYWPRTDEPFRSDRTVLEQIACEVLTPR